MAIHITTAVGLQNIELDLTEDYILDNDINLTAVTWTPISDFTGTFDGQGFTISNLTYSGIDGTFALFDTISGTAAISDLNLDNFSLTLDADTADAACLVSTVADTASITNCHVTNSTITYTVNAEAFSSVGLLASFWDGTGNLDTCSATGTINASAIIDGSTGAVGGLVGIVHANAVANCSANVAITIGNINTTDMNLSSVSTFIGVLDSNTSLTDCSSTGSLDIFCPSLIGSLGGLVGFGQDGNSFIRCSYEGSIRVRPTNTDVGGLSMGGGLFGFIDDDTVISDCRVDIDFDFEGGAVGFGGFCGRVGDTSTINKCFVEGDIVVDGTLVFSAAAFITFQGTDSVILNCYSHANIASTASGFMGNLSGFTAFAGEELIKNCYATGSISSSAAGGGLVGGFSAFGGELINCYYAGTISVTDASFIGGFLGSPDSGAPDPLNCAWFTGSTTDAVGSPASSLSAVGYGTDESDAATFYLTDHVVYDQGNVNAWDFTSPVWFTNCEDYPDFVGSICPITPTNSSWSFMQGQSFGSCLVGAASTWNPITLPTENCP